MLLQQRLAGANPNLQLRRTWNHGSVLFSVSPAARLLTHQLVHIYISPTCSINDQESWRELHVLHFNQVLEKAEREEQQEQFAHRHALKPMNESKGRRVCLMLSLLMCLLLINVPEKKLTAPSQPLPAGWCHDLKSTAGAHLAPRPGPRHHHDVPLGAGGWTGWLINVSDAVWISAAANVSGSSDDVISPLEDVAGSVKPFSTCFNTVKTFSR